MIIIIIIFPRGIQSNLETEKMGEGDVRIA